MHMRSAAQATLHTSSDWGGSAAGASSEQSAVQHIRTSPTHAHARRLFERPATNTRKPAGRPSSTPACGKPTRPHPPPTPMPHCMISTRRHPPCLVSFPIRARPCGSEGRAHRAARPATPAGRTGCQSRLRTRDGLPARQHRAAARVRALRRLAVSCAAQHARAQSSRPHHHSQPQQVGTTC